MHVVVVITLLSLSSALGACAAKTPMAPRPSAAELAAETPQSSSRIVVEHLEGPTPWTHLNAQTGPDAFQFAVVTDRTGGMRPGVFASAVKKLNLLHPEFVLSVGDLIQGYTDDVAQVNREWDQFDGVIGELHAPFFYLPGNHDITNEAMRRIWEERYGPSHYAFVYRDVLFICLDTNDGGLHQMQAAQIKWLEGVLQQYSAVRWTLLFMHNPLWDDEKTFDGAERDISTWEAIEAVLGERRYTAFAGHHHAYTKHVRRDRKHFTLATTGGGSSLRGPRFGEFDHVVWVTLLEDGPLIANLSLDGIWDENVRTEELRMVQRALYAPDNLNPATIYFSGQFRNGQTQVRVRNPYDEPLSVVLAPGLAHGVQVTPSGAIEFVVPPNSVHDQVFQIRLSAPDRGQQGSAPLAWRVTTTTPEGDSVEYRGKAMFSWVRTLPTPKSQPIVVDGRLQEWGKLEFAAIEPAQIVPDAGHWNGPKDGTFSVGLRQDEQFLYVGLSVQDDEVLARPGVAPWRQDGLEVRIDARGDPLRAHYAPAVDGADVFTLALVPHGLTEESCVYREDWIVEVPGVQAACARHDNGYSAEIALPKAWIAEAGASDGRIRVNVAVDDQDADGRAQLWWWPDWRSPQHLPGTGTFDL